jgi:1-acyl-sn-glycerol-3-phosphate acyltransferase
VLDLPNHTSHFDTIIVLSILPSRLYDRTAVAAAADRFYRRWLQGLWFSLRYNTFPITRGGGRGALEYSTRLLREGWSLLIFPEGTRSRSGELQRFHPGPALLAMSRQAPVLPIYMEGAAGILQPGTRRARPAPVCVRVGAPLKFAQGTDVMEANAQIEAAVRALAGRPAAGVTISPGR